MSMDNNTLIAALCAKIIELNAERTKLCTAVLRAERRAASAKHEALDIHEDRMKAHAECERHRKMYFEQRDAYVSLLTQNEELRTENKELHMQIAIKEES